MVRHLPAFAMPISSIAFPVDAFREWGQEVNGLKISAAIEPNEFGNREAIMMVQNTTFYAQPNNLQKAAKPSR